MGKKKVGIVVVVLMAVLLLAYYFHMSNRMEQTQDDYVPTAVQNVLLKNLDTNYPPTPKEVVKYYSEVTKCLHNEEYTDEQLEQMADKLLALFDTELLAINPRDEYIVDLKADVISFKDEGYSITTFTPSSSTDVEFYEIDGDEMAQLYCDYTIKSKAEYSTSKHLFVLRKESETGHWKIFGFEVPETK
ncbi:MAG: hypothetical protein E7290_12885 [Lachnospiraceae bacterium]|nr:hypothetical protein [Lachnospiraceae bacterium]